MLLLFVIYIIQNLEKYAPHFSTAKMSESAFAIVEEIIKSTPNIGQTVNCNIYYEAVSIIKFVI